MNQSSFQIQFPEYSGLRCLMMPYIQGEPASVPDEFASYRAIIGSVFIQNGDIGFLTVDESPVRAGDCHRGKRAKYGRALHTEAGRSPEGLLCWGGGTWGGNTNVLLARDVRVLIGSNIDETSAVWDAEHVNTSSDGDIGDVSHLYPYETATLLRAGDVHEIGILTPHESLPARQTTNRQFLRIVSAGVYGREPYFTQNPLVHL